MNRNTFLLVISTLFFHLAFANPAISVRQYVQTAKTKAAITRGSQLFQQKKYKDAYNFFNKAAKANPRDPIIQFYLGLSAIYTSNMRIAKSALAKAVVATNFNTAYHKRAKEYLHKYFRESAYSCLLKRRNLASWDKSAMPLKIYISDGRMLPGGMANKILAKEDLLKINKWTRDPRFIPRLPRAKLYKSEFKRYINRGIQPWGWAQHERLISYRFTSNPVEADIIVLWTDALPGYRGFTYLPYPKRGQRAPCLVVMSLKDTDNPRFPSETSLTCTTTHEFGHVFGLEHNRDKTSIMIPKEKWIAIKPISRSDKTSFRALYSMPPDHRMLSVSVK